MSGLAVPGFTGRFDLEGRFDMEDWLSSRSTGAEYNIERSRWFVLARMWGIEADAGPTHEEPDVGDLRGQALAIAAERPYVETVRPTRPVLTGNLAEDVHGISGLTWGDIAGLYGISERAVAGWRTQGVPRHRIELMQALRAIGAMLVGGLGREGVGRWLTVGSPSRLDRLAEGDEAGVVAEARSYADSPAT